MHCRVDVDLLPIVQVKRHLIAAPTVSINNLPADTFLHKKVQQAVRCPGTCIECNTDAGASAVKGAVVTIFAVTCLAVGAYKLDQALPTLRPFLAGTVPRRAVVVFLS